MRAQPVLLAVLVVLTSGCYKATIETGRQPSGETIRQEWAHSFVAGLVPPATVETAARCPNGVARVQTQHSFLNMVAQALTFSLYSPMTIEVHCAAQRDEEQALTLVVPEGASPTVAARIIDRAAVVSADRRAPVLVRFE